MRLKEVTKWLGIVLSIAVMVGIVNANPAVAARKNVIIGSLTWSGSQAIEQIMKYVLEEKLDTPVEITNLAQAVLFAAMDKGSADVYPDMWIPNQQAGFDKYVKERKTIAVKLSYDNASEGIWMPAKIAQKHGIKSVFDLKGKDLGWCVVGNVYAFDFEDVASFTLGQKNYLLVGDIGNNGLASTVQILYLIEEPPIDGNGKVKAERAPVVQIMNYCYEDDHRDCEALAVDPTSRTILLVSKENGSLCYVYALAWPKNDPNEATVARKIATLKVPPVTAMDVSPDGRRAAVLDDDTLHQDILGANNIGLHSVWITRRADRPENMANHGLIVPDSVIHALSELPALVKNLG